MIDTKKKDRKQKVDLFSDGNPRMVGDLTGQLQPVCCMGFILSPGGMIWMMQKAKLLKCTDAFIPQRHEHDDALLHVVMGHVSIRFGQRQFTLRPDQMLVIPKGLVYYLYTTENALLMIFEPFKGAKNNHLTIGKLCPN